MAGYLLNLTFAQPVAAASATGLFNSNSVSATSKQWYTIPSSWQPGISPNVPGPVSVVAQLSSWTQTAPYPLKDDFLFFCNLNDDLYVRMAPDPAWLLTSGQSLQLVFFALFGRPATASHAGDTLASPFVLGSYPRTVLFWVNVPPTVTSDGSWIYYLGRPSQNVSGQGSSPAVPNRLRAYSCIVAAEVQVWQSGSAIATYTYGHDPEMGVQG
jgi:hypothetical protein